MKKKFNQSAALIGAIVVMILVALIASVLQRVSDISNENMIVIMLCVIAGLLGGIIVQLRFINDDE